MQIKHTALIVLMLFAISGSNCKKKISKYPFDMSGVWFSDDECEIVLEINNDGSGKVFSLGGFCMGGDVSEKGKVKYKKDILYVHNKKYEIFNEPKLYAGNDSISAPDQNDLSGGKFKSYRILASMTLQQKGLLSFKETYNFFKYVDY